MAFEQLSHEQKQRLELEVVPKVARLRLTRMLRARTHHQDQNISIIKRNMVVNIARAVLGLSVYVLESDADGMYEPAEHAWHNGELELATRRPTTPQLIEVIADLIAEEWLDSEEVNNVLAENGCAVSFYVTMDGDVRVDVPSIEEINKADLSTVHPNIRILADRMDRSLANGDYSAVVHASGSIFETLAKEVIAISTVENQSLGQFFDKYRSKSKLPEPVLNYIQDIFRQRNKEPLAGHGSLVEPNVTKDEAVLLVEMTKALVRAERTLSEPKLDPSK